MKKGVVLLVTLLFITAISVLILKNLDDSNKFLENQNYIINNSQVLISIKNLQVEVAKLISKNKDNIDKALEDDFFKVPLNLNIENLNIDFTLKKYDKININDMNDKDSTTVEKLFLKNDIFDYDSFKQVYKKKLQGSNLKVTTTKQVDDIIKTFNKETQNQKIIQIKDKLGFLTNKNLYELNLHISYFSSKAKAYYILNNEGEVKYFDISFI